MLVGSYMESNKHPVLRYYPVYVHACFRPTTKLGVNKILKDKTLQLFVL